MLGKWMDWIKKQFHQNDDNDDDIEVNKEKKLEQPVTNTSYQQELKARVTYQYPKQRSFRFPVIPDQSTERKERRQDKLDEDRFEKSVHSQQEKEQTYEPELEYEQEQKYEQESEFQNQNNHTTWKDNNIHKKSKEPFQVSEIPSPIYGFQKRTEKATEPVEYDIPTYIPREESEKLEFEISEDQFASDVKNEEEVKPSTEDESITMIEFSQEKEAEMGNVDNKEQQLEVRVPLTTSEEDNKRIEPAVTENDNKQESEDLKEIAATAESIIEEEETTIPLKNEPKEDNPERSQSAFPFNVIMTPSDKRNLRKKQTEQKNEEHKENKLEEIPEIEEAEEVVVQHSDLPKQQNSDDSKPVFPFNVIMTPSDKRNLRRDQTELRKEEKHRENEIEMMPVEAEAQTSEQPIQQKPVKEIPYHLLNDPVNQTDDDQAWVEKQQHLLEETLKHFNVRANVVKATQGPSVTRFEVQPELGVKVSKIKNLSDDLKLNMSAKDIRIEAPIPGKNTVGIEIPNLHAQTVGLQEIFETEAFKESKSPLSVALGLSIEGEPKVTDIQKMPHGLIAGATGSGKSVCINTMLVSLLYKSSHEDVRILLIDPKMVELAPYNGIPHLITPVITDVKAATQSLKWAVEEMEGRYEKFVHEGVRNIEAFNKKITQQHRMEEKMPFIVIVIDELADLMMTAPHDVEDSISRIAQKARACGIHLIVATQRPSVDVITGLIKANIPTRIAFSVSSQVDSRTIIDVSGAEKLLGKGDMLFVENGAGKSVRLQGPFVSDEEVERVTNYARSIAEPNYLFEQDDLLEQIHVDEEEDELLEDVIDFILQQNSASTSMIQRRFKIGYNRAARLMDSLEYKGIISGQNGSKPREVLISKKQEEM